MKTWKDITKDQKDMLHMYYNMSLSYKIYCVTFLSVGYIAFIVGIPLIFVPHLGIRSAGLILFVLSMFLSFVVLYRIQIKEKELKLIFGIDDIMEDIFEISQSDMRKVKKKWVKIK